MANSSATDSGATRSTARADSWLSSCSSQTTSLRSGIAGANDARIRDAVSDISVSTAPASARTDAVVVSLPVSIAERAALAASRSALR
ncbi:Uncharacterised protein [Mycobacterium tuberculosis]|nr:Uncharacterised protein [Mycobacterium tuberculosis]CKU46658.1 Uncharacterised protein [Mycobacterium tuberculosis]CNN21872.1 Uncharacterised protein [Mycobacterium tuberculosis]